MYGICKLHPLKNFPVEHYSELERLIQKRMDIQAYEDTLSKAVLFVKLCHLSWL